MRHLELASILVVLAQLLLQLWRMAQPHLFRWAGAALLQFVPMTVTGYDDVASVVATRLKPFAVWWPAATTRGRAPFTMTLLRHEGRQVLLLIEPYTPPRFADDIPDQRFCFIGKIRDRAFFEEMAEQPSRKSAISVDGPRGYREVLIPAPGAGCHPQVWSRVRPVVEKARASVKGRARAGAPLGGAFLLVGPPGTGKSTLPVHVAALLPDCPVQEFDFTHAMALAKEGFPSWEQGSAYFDEIEDEEGLPGVDIRWSVGLVDDIDRFTAQCSSVAMQRLLAWIENSTVAHPRFLFMTANSLAGLNSAFLSRVQVEFTGPPAEEQLVHLAASLCYVSVEEAAAAVAAFPDTPTDLRVFRRACLQVDSVDQLPAAYRKITQDTAEALLLAFELEDPEDLVLYEDEFGDDDEEDSVK